jgi:hypothetical protein
MLSCSCCGTLLRNSPEENASYGQVPYPHDTGFGMCRDCGGDPKGAEKLEKAGADSAAVARKAMGWAMAMFVDARISRLREALGEENRAKLDAMPYSKQAEVVCRMVESGRMT